MQGEEKTPVEGEDVARGDEAAVEEEETAAAWKRAQSRKWLRTLLSRKLLNKRLIVHWPQLLLVPLFPSLVAVCTIFFSSLVLNLAELQCVRPLQLFLEIDLVLCYFLLFGYGWLLIGPVPVTSFYKVFVCGLVYFFVVCLWYIIGSAWLNGAGPCLDSSPGLYRMAFAKVALFWIGIIVIVGYGVKYIMDQRRKADMEFQQQELEREEQVKAALEEEIRREQARLQQQKEEREEMERKLRERRQASKRRLGRPDGDEALAAGEAGALED